MHKIFPSEVKMGDFTAKNVLSGIAYYKYQWSQI